MTNFLCSVSGRFPENYDIGVRANRWGVEEKYEKKIRDVRAGDTLVFVVGGAFRSIHRIESEPFFDNTPLWPKKDGSLFPHRIKISDPFKRGRLPVKEIAAQISFMEGKFWGGTIQGPHGVFNKRLTDADTRIIRKHLAERPRTRKKGEIKAAKESSERQTALFKFYEKDIEDRISHLLPKMDLSIYKDEKTGKTGQQYVTDVGRIDLLCTDVSSGKFVVVELKKGEAPDQTLLQILRYMSWVRQNMAGKKGVRGIILTEAADSSLVEVVKEVQNVDIKYYRLTIELV